MSRFLLKANYETNSVLSSIEQNKVIVDVPFIKDGKLIYGLDHVITNLAQRSIFPSELGYDMLILASMVYMADTRISRELHAEDSWTRQIELEIPVSNKNLWDCQKSTLERMLKFLTGDIWTISFTQRSMVFGEEKSGDEKTDKYNNVSLFSGGMDSLISTINLMENNGNTLLISHAGDSYTKKSQFEIINKFNKIYPDVMHTWVDIWMVFDHNYIPYGGNETSTRSRSFLFIGLAVFAITGMKNINQLLVPENGLIALNVPLDMTRLGSYSTKTTHPFYLKMWNDLLSNLGLDLKIINPYWNKTKGEMASECQNRQELFDIIKYSCSCSSPGKARWSKLSPQHCGYCVPCIIRRAAIYKAFGKDSTTYTYSSIKGLEKDHASVRGQQLRSFQYVIQKIKSNPELAEIYIHKSGPLENDKVYLNELADTYRRGLLEVDSFICAELNSDEV